MCCFVVGRGFVVLLVLELRAEVGEDFLTVLMLFETTILHVCTAVQNNIHVVSYKYLRVQLTFHNINFLAKFSIL